MNENKISIDKLISDNVCRLDTESLKALWDCEDESIVDATGFALDAIHRELNLRGEGKYCAV